MIKHHGAMRAVRQVAIEACGQKALQCAAGSAPNLYVDAHRYVDREGELRPARVPPGRMESLLPPSAQLMQQLQQ